MLQAIQEAAAMSRVPLPDSTANLLRPYRPEPTPADYSDEVCEENFAALQKLVQAEAEDDDFEMVDGPAW